MNDISELRKKSLKELKELSTAKKTRRGLLIEANGGSEIVLGEPVRNYRKDGQIEHETVSEFDIETGGLVRRVSMTWTYYKTGEVDEITTLDTDADGHGIRRVIKHYLDRQPTVKEVSV